MEQNKKTLIIIFRSNIELIIWKVINWNGGYGWTATILEKELEINHTH